MAFGDLVQVREAARRYLAKSLDSGARVAIVTASGRPQLAFTNKRELIDQALSQLNFNRRFEPTECPNLPPAFAQLVLDDIPQVGGRGPSLAVSAESGQDPASVASAVIEDKPLKIAEAMAGAQRCAALGDEEMRNRARNIVFKSDLGVQVTLAALDSLVRTMAETPGGQRTIAVVSAGFYSKNMERRLDQLVDRALRANVVVSTLDARGLYAEPPGGSLSEIAVSPQIQAKIDDEGHQSRETDADALSAMADGTGGVFVQNTNDMEGGLAKASGQAPGYILGFIPDSFKSDGRFHTLQVKLVSGGHFNIQARRGYFVPEGTDAKTVTREERMELAAFSQDNFSAFPLQLGTTVARIDATTHRLSVVVGADMRAAEFVKQGDLHVDDITVLVVVFDLDGNFVTAGQQTVKLRLADAAFKELRRTGGETTIELTLRRGAYTVRAVLGDSASSEIGSAVKSITIR